MTEDENKMTISFIKTKVRPWIGYETNWKGDPVPKHYLWSQLITSAAQQRYQQAAELIQKDLEAGRKIIAISDRKSLLEKLLRKFVNDGVTVRFLQGDCCSTERKEIWEAVKNHDVALLLTTKLLECATEMQGANIAKEPVSQHFDTVHILTPTVASFERRCMLPIPLKIRKAFPLQNEAVQKKPVQIRYYVDDNPWLESCAFKNKKVAKKNGWVVEDV